MFIKHKYLTMPKITKTQAVLKASKDLKQALEGSIPQESLAKQAIEHLMQAFKWTAGTETENKNTQQEENEQQSQKVQAPERPAQRVQREENTAGNDKTKRNMPAGKQHKAPAPPTS